MVKQKKINNCLLNLLNLPSIKYLKTIKKHTKFKVFFRLKKFLKVLLNFALTYYIIVDIYTT
jgi:hypothetical protein